MPYAYRYEFQGEYPSMWTMGFRAMDAGRGRPTAFLAEREHTRRKLEERHEDEEEQRRIAASPEKLRKFFEKPGPKGAQKEEGGKGQVEPIAHRDQWQVQAQWSQHARWQPWASWSTWWDSQTWGAWDWQQW